ncbi:MAG TPA: protein kinase [Pyrinomonadaceae bacterium]|jgi:serine/threonine protein kinase/tetratricopeptide (TPR) repeat protein
MASNVIVIGEKIGHYKVQSSIGAGGMGEIYRASDTRLRRDVAIKILPESLIKDVSAIERFRREAYAASALNHPNILTIFDIGEHEKTHFIATEFVEGETLRQKMQSARLRLTEILEIAIQTAGALVAAHEAGIIHRDIKPENIMIRRDGYVKVLDFGIAKLTEKEAPPEPDANAETLVQSITAQGMILGTAFYMSPEQARALKVDARSDVFSLGAVIYEMTARRLPFSGATIADVIASILTSEPKPLSEFVGNLPPEFERIVAKALNKKRADRFQTMKEFANDLKQIRQRLEFETELQRIHVSNDSAALSGEIYPLESATQILPKQRKTRTRKTIDSLAVLPLVNSRRDAETEYLSDGITECIINSLSKLPKLRVVPRSTVFRYKNKAADAQQIGIELGVRAVFSGRILQIGDSVIVSAELVDIANEAQIWGENYRREMTDIFTLLDEIAEDISEKLRLKLSGEDKKQLSKRYTENSEAYQFYLKGRYFVTSKRTEEWIKKGIEYFQKAIDLDPNYALAFSGIAEAYGFLASSTGGWRPHDAYPKAEAAALKALELDESLGEAHCSMGFSRLLYDWNFAEAGREFRRAIELSPNYPNSHDGLGFYLKAVGRHAEAIEKCKEAQRLDPLSPFAHVSLGYAYYFARDYDHAIEECRKALEMDKVSTFAHRNLGLAFLQQGKIEKAIEALSNAVKFSQGGLAFESYLGFAYAVAGKRNEALEVLASLEDLDRERYVPAYNFAIIHAGLGDFDKAFEWFEQARRERSGFLPFLNVEPVVDCLRGDARFEELLKKIGLI